MHQSSSFFFLPFLPLTDITKQVVEAIRVVEGLLRVGIHILWRVAGELAFADPASRSGSRIYVGHGIGGTVVG